MSLGVYPLLEYLGIVWEGWILVLLWLFGKIHLWSHPVQDFCLLGVLIYCFSFSSGNPSVQILQFFLNQLWKLISISSRLSNLLVYSVHNIFLQFFVIFLVCRSFLKIVLSLLVWESKRKGENQGDRNIDLFFFLLMHLLVASCICLDWGLNLWPRHISTML